MELTSLTLRCSVNIVDQKGHPARTSCLVFSRSNSAIDVLTFYNRSIYVTQVTSSRKGRTGKEPSFGASTTGFSLGTGIPMSGSGIVRGTSGGLTLADMNGLGGGMDTIRAGHVGDVEPTGNGDWFRANKRARMT